MNPFRAALPALLLTASLVALSGCSHHPVEAYAPPAPYAGAPAYNNGSSGYNNGYPTQPALTADQQYVESHQPIATQVGLASWYGPMYNHHAAADGTVYHQNQLSAAHRTLPLGSIVKVTNLNTGQSAVMRINDRGPFIPGRIIDLSAASARAVGLYRAGVGRVRVDVYYSPVPINSGGRWAVQIGAFHSKRDAIRLENHLQRKYRTASVIEFKGPTGDWVRIRPYNGNHQIALEIVDSLRPKQGAAFLVRLD